MNRVGKVDFGWIFRISKFENWVWKIDFRWISWIFIVENRFSEKSIFYGFFDLNRVGENDFWKSSFLKIHFWSIFWWDDFRFDSSLKNRFALDFLNFDFLKSIFRKIHFWSISNSNRKNDFRFYSSVKNGIAINFLNLNVDSSKNWFSVDFLDFNFPRNPFPIDFRFKSNPDNRILIFENQVWKIDLQWISWILIF